MLPHLLDEQMYLPHVLGPLQMGISMLPLFSSQDMLEGLQLYSTAAVPQPDVGICDTSAALQQLHVIKQSVLEFFRGTESMENICTSYTGEFIKVGLQNQRAGGHNSCFNQESSKRGIKTAAPVQGEKSGNLLQSSGVSLYWKGEGTGDWCPSDGKDKLFKNGYISFSSFLIPSRLSLLVDITCISVGLFPSACWPVSHSETQPELCFTNTQGIS